MNFGIYLTVAILANAQAQYCKLFLFILKFFNLLGRRLQRLIGLHIREALYITLILKNLGRFTSENKMIPIFSMRWSLNYSRQCLGELLIHKTFRASSKEQDFFLLDEITTLE